jgi:hypothetical protein
MWHVKGVRADAAAYSAVGRAHEEKKIVLLAWQ